MWNIKYFILIYFLQEYTNALGILYPRPTPTRFIVPLDGLWKFTFAVNGSFDNKDSLLGDPNNKDLHWMNVPASYNDVLTSAGAKDYVGPVRYERSFFVPSSWSTSNRYWIRFGSVTHSAELHINGKFVASHGIGHLPFVHEVNNFLQYGKNILTVIVDNTLSEDTIPQGSQEVLSSGRVKLNYDFDFYDYAGIDRSVILYKTPRVFIDDVTMNSSYIDSRGLVFFSVKINGTYVDTYQVDYTVTILNKNNEVMSKTEKTLKYLDDFYATAEIPNANPWLPYGMSEEPGYLYTMQIEIVASTAELVHVVDQYELKFGIRNLEWDQNVLNINGKPIYIKGLGKHEDSDIKGRGFDFPLVIREHNLLRWLGINCYRTTHYPHAEEVMDLADSLGIMIINEAPAVAIQTYNDALMDNHKLALSELYQRDKNRPSVIMWSIANEPNLLLDDAVNYFKEIAFHIKTLDLNRPITLTNNHELEGSVDVFQFLDIISINRYEGWYQNAANTTAIPESIVNTLTSWHEAYNKPVLLTEYGAHSMVEEHGLPEYIWSSEYHNDVLLKHFEAFDQLRSKEWFLGEMVWTFSDFMTSARIFRQGGNKKGLFTRQRQPKEAAHLLRKRYLSLL